jgi:ribonuclease D
LKRLTKEEISTLPLFVGLPVEATYIVSNKHKAKLAIEHISEYSVLGFDTESKPCFTKGEISTGPHLIQISTPEKVFLFPAEATEAVNFLFPILENSEIKKVGFGLKADRVLLSKKFNVDLSGTIDLARLIQRRLKLENSIGARNSVAMILRKKLSKMAQMSNWAARPLKPKQIEYASNDAYSALVTYMRFMDLQSDDVMMKNVGL